MSERKTTFVRKSKETEISATVNVDGSGKAEITTHIGLLDHMLELFSFHGFFDLNLNVQKADFEIDIHHANEDIGIVLGKIFKKALDEKEGIKRFGSGFAPMESTLGHSVIDISGRGYLHLTVEGVRVENLTEKTEREAYSFQHVEHLLESFAHQLGANLIIHVKNPEGSSADLHTIMETIFKSLGLALDQATTIDPRRKGDIPSTKGIID